MNTILILTIMTSHVAYGQIFNHGGHGPGGFSGAGAFGSICMSLHSYCPSYVTMTCQHGLAKDTHGCDLCACATAPHDPLVAPQVHHQINNPCVPTHALCTLDCDHYMDGVGGCQFCMCDNSHATHNPVTTTNAPTSVQSTPLPVVLANTVSTATSDSTVTSGGTTQDPVDCIIAKQICESKCNGEYLSDPHNCTFCVCKSDLPGLLHR